MYSSPSFANHRPFEGTTDTNGTTILYDIPVRQIMIINDNASGSSLEYTINNNTNYATLKPKESISMWCRTTSLTIRGATGNVTYRTNGLG